MLACVTIMASGVTLTLGGGDMIIYLMGGELKINYVPPQSGKSSRVPPIMTNEHKYFFYIFVMKYF